MEKEIERRMDSLIRERYEREHRERLEERIDKLTARVDALERILGRGDK
jgi:ferritin-like metal-binding protein YciE